MNKIFLQFVLFSLIFSFTPMSNSQTIKGSGGPVIRPQSETYFQEYVPLEVSKIELSKTIKLRTAAKEWAHKNIEGLENIIHEQSLIGVYYILSLFYNRVADLDSQSAFYNSVLEEKKKTGALYEQIELQDRDLKIVFFKNPQSIIDFYPGMAPYKDTPLEEMYGIPGASSTIEDLPMFSARKTCLLNVNFLSPYPKGYHNSFYYLFANFLHTTALTPEEFATLEKLYETAKTNDLFLDDFSALSVYPYFAHAVEAYVSETKEDSLKKNTQNHLISYGHERTDLQKNDPELYSFIEGLIETY